ncbi:hypothetical protein [Streptomyces sp. NPDC059994]|uniref:hypothetical protein n=1 Tax=Streptomyces sp. NPDC059994 TaxID=3347029 RepID=UPI0036B5849F
MTSLAVNYGTEIDWGNPGFIEVYAYAFGVSTILTVLLWLFAVAKRAAQGVPFPQALGESIGYLLLSVMVSAFAPAAVAYTVQLMDGAAEAMLSSQTVKLAVLGTLVVGCLLALAGTGIGAPLALIIGFLLIVILLGIWLLLVVRNALILCGLVFGPTVFSGLVNKDLWQHTRKWVGVMVAIIAVKYVVYTVLALAIALTEGLPHNVGDLSFGQALGTLMMISALFWIALLAPFQIGKFVPILGDELQATLSARSSLFDQAKSAYEQGSSAYGNFKELDNPRLSGAGSDGAGEGGDSPRSGDGGGDTPPADGSSTGAQAASGQRPEDFEADAFEHEQQTSTADTDPGASDGDAGAGDSDAEQAPATEGSPAAIEEGHNSALSSAEPPGRHEAVEPPLPTAAAGAAPPASAPAAGGASPYSAAEGAVVPDPVPVTAPAFALDDYFDIGKE